MSLAVAARDVSYRYDGHVAVAPSSFDIPDGGISAMIGPNGSGKSTLFSGIAGLRKPVSGSLEVLPLDGRPRRISYVLQAIRVNESLPITVGEVVTMGRYPGIGPYRRLTRLDRSAVDAAIDRMGIGDLTSRHLDELSGGQRQRVFVAQGLAQEHDILLLDEPLTGLDVASARAIDEVIHDEHRRGCTIVITTHDLAEAGVADHVILLANGVVAAGPPGEVLTPANLTRAYGASLLHRQGEPIFIDDPAHRPVPGRHLHRDRTIHVEPSPQDRHTPPP